MTYGLLLPLFFTFCLIYCLLLTLFQYFMSPDFRSSTHGERVKIVLKLFIIPEANGDCQTREWKLEMLLLGLLQVISNLILLVPFFVAAHQIRSRHEDLEKAIETSEEEKYAYWLVTLLAWLLPTLVIVGGLLDGLFVFILWKEKQPKEQVDERKAEEKTSKMQKFLQLLRYLLLLINRIGTKVMVFLPVMIAMTYYYEATSSLNQDTLTRFNATTQMWKMEGTNCSKLMNRAGMFDSDDTWISIPLHQ